MNFIVMPIIARHGEGDGFPNTIAIPTDRDDQAVINHSQSLQRLKQRGGLAPSEAVAIMRRQRWQKLDRDSLLQAFREFEWT